jgi:hypothetical protein
MKILTKAAITALRDSIERVNIALTSGLNEVCFMLIRLTPNE